ncbi:BglG family transcription antiterminator [Amphibacillus xylanus]|uniref:Putative transcriptional regulator n=1 Tax=Amphibacillus xylanus (strain ATCC 51415 / DSM 6626 / JCM 7361 / LMG 17667 / NBRC 15112 / Ep01) TaxID=698758 RepID=K0J4P9_AMPXN|nr:BglG family transcription antiterminator [Amphibacillus xylanus]BAM48317.1 putative transcriptional regulator [Amphibacillus xylanus NBRC 15112]
MSARLFSILRVLMANEKPVTSEYIAQLLNVTSRTIRDDIKILDRILQDFGANIQSIRGIGFQLIIDNDHEFRSFLNQKLNEQTVPNSPEERITYLIKRFLLADSYLKLDDLCEEMHISKSTIQNDLRSVKKIFKQYNLSLQQKPTYGLKLYGNEVKMRFALSEHIFDRSEPISKTTWIKQLAQITEISLEELEKVWSIIIKEIKVNQIYLSDIAINNLFIHIIIAYKRIKDGHYVSLIHQDLKEIKLQKEYQVALSIVRKTETILEIKFPDVEIAYITIHLLGTKMVKQSKLTETEFENILEKQTQVLTTKILDLIEAKMNLGIRHDQELIIGLGLHLKPAINRYKYGMNIRNPMLNDIKLNYPVAFEAAVMAGMVLDNEINVLIDENEIGYIALHIGAAIERKKLKTGPKKCFIVCASGLGSAHLIKYKLQSVLGSQIQVMGTTEFYQLKQIPFSEIDFIISSVPIQEKLPCPVIVVNTILSETDLDRIKTHLNKRTETINDYIKEEFVFLNQTFPTKESALQFLVNQIKTKMSLPDNYLDLIYEREEVAPTAYGNLVAIPHPITAQAKETFLTICTLQKPINWSNKRVQLICLLNVEKDGHKDLEIMYKGLIKVIEDPTIVQQLIQARNYSEFIKPLLQLYS